MAGSPQHPNNTPGRVQADESGAREDRPSFPLWKSWGRASRDQERARPAVNVFAVWAGENHLRVAYMSNRTIQVVQIPCPTGDTPHDGGARPAVLLSVNCPADTVITHLALSEGIVAYAGFNPQYPPKARKSIISALQYRPQDAPDDGERPEAMTFTVPGRVKSFEFSPSGQLFLITKQGADRYFFSRYRFEEEVLPPATAGVGLLSRPPGSAGSSAGFSSAGPTGSAGLAAAEELRARLPTTKLTCLCLSEGRERLRYQFRTCHPTPSMCICGHYCSYAALENRRNPSTLPFSAYFNDSFPTKRDGRAAIQRDHRASLAAQGVLGTGNSSLFFEHLACSVSEGGNYLLGVSPGQTNLDLYADYSPFASCQLTGRGCLDSNLRKSHVVDVALCPRSFGLFAAVNHNGLTRRGGRRKSGRGFGAILPAAVPPIRESRGTGGGPADNMAGVPGGVSMGAAANAPVGAAASALASTLTSVPADAPADALHPMNISAHAASSLLYFAPPLVSVRNRIRVGESCYAYALARGGAQVLLLLPDRFEYRSCVDWGKGASWCLAPTEVGLYRALLSDYASPELQSFRVEPESQSIHLTYKLSESDATIISLALHSSDYTPAERTAAIAEENRRCEHAYAQLRQRRASGAESGSTATGGSLASFVSITSAAPAGSMILGRGPSSARVGAPKEYDVREQGESTIGSGARTGSCWAPMEDAGESPKSSSRAGAKAKAVIPTALAPPASSEDHAVSVTRTDEGGRQSNEGWGGSGDGGGPGSATIEVGGEIRSGDNDMIDLDAIDSNV